MRGFGLAAICAGACVGVLSLSNGEAQAQQGAATTACIEALEADYGSDKVVSARERRRTGRRFIYVTTQLSDGREVDYRCIVSQNTVRSVDARSGVSDWEPASRIARVEEPEEPEATQAEAEAEPAAQEESRPRFYRIDQGEGYSPSEGVTCYKKRRACYGADGRLDLAATAAEF